MSSVSGALSSVRIRPGWHPVAFLVYLGAQGFVVAGLVTPRFPDSAGYFTVSFTGNALRLWTVPLFYKLFPNDAARVTAQVVLAAICWWVLASEASKIVRDRRIRIGVRAVLLTLGAVSPIAEFNSTILSDSVAISLCALLVAAWIRHAAGPTWRTATFVGVTTLFWTFTRNDLVLVGLGITALVVVVTALRLRSAIHLGLATGLVLISAWGLAIDGRNTYVANANIADVLEDRVFVNPGWTQWWIGQGMPWSSAIESTTGGQYGLGLMAIPSFNTWLSENGARTYVDFMLTHPTYTLWDALPDFSGEQATVNNPNTTTYTYTQPNPTPSMISPTANYGRHRDLFPSVVEELLFEQGQIGDVVLLAAAAFAAAALARRRLGPDARMWVPIIVTALTVPQGYVVWLFGGDGETDRHSIVMAASVRIGLWIVLGYAIDRLLIDRREAGEHPEPA